MNLKEISILQAEKLLKSECIWGRISEDGQSQKEFRIWSRREHVWLGIFVKKKLIGCFFLHPENSTTIVIHIQILEKYREKHAFESGVMAQDQFIKSKYNKMICQIPEIYQDVYHFTKKFGLVDEGINRASFTKNGRVHNQLRLGITKEEAKSWLQRQ